MVYFASHSKARIVVGSDDVRHLHLRAQSLGKFHTTVHDHIGMISTMCRIEAIVARKYLALYVRFKFLSNHNGLTLQPPQQSYRARGTCAQGHAPPLP